MMKALTYIANHWRGKLNLWRTCLARFGKRRSLIAAVTLTLLIAVGITYSALNLVTKPKPLLELIGQTVVSGDGPSIPKVVEVFDANGDGKLDIDEAPLPMRAHFKTLDSNGDGAIDQDEAKRAEQLRAASTSGTISIMMILEQFDKNGDGKLQKDEAPGPLQRRFGVIDANSDGAIDTDEAKRIDALRNRK